MEDFAKQACYFFLPSNVPWSKVGILGMVIPPLYNRNSFNGHINPYCWVDDHPLLYENNGTLDSELASDPRKSDAPSTGAGSQLN